MSSKLNDIVLDVMKKMKRNYKDRPEYKIIMTGLKSTSKALAEITAKEMADFKTNDE